MHPSPLKTSGEPVAQTNSQSMHCNPAIDHYQAARTWWKHGYNVVPQNTAGKKYPAVKWKSLQTRRVTEAELANWKNLFRHGVGFITGEVSNAIVIETDGEDGEKLIAEYERQHGALPKTLTICSGSGRGIHRHFRHPGNKVPTTSNTQIQIDIRGDGGFCILPPSRHKSGGVYKVIIGCRPAPLPQKLLSFIASKATTASTVPQKPGNFGTNVIAWPLGEVPHYLRTWSVEPNIDLHAEQGKISTEKMAEMLSFLATRGVFADRKDVVTDAEGHITRVGWIECGMALKREYGDRGAKLWALTHIDDRARADATAQWASFSTVTRDGDVTIGTVVKAARDAGFSNDHQHELEPHRGPSSENVSAADDDDEDEVTLLRLATLPPMEYEKLRVDEADKLGVRVTVLDGEVEKRREQDSDGGLQGVIVEFDAIDPWPTVVDGAELLDELMSAFQRYVVIDQKSLIGITLWCVFAHCYDCFEHSPRLALQSPEPRCGKTTVAKVCEKLVPRALRADNVTVAALFRMIELYSPVLLIDEADTFAVDNEELRGIINSGHERAGGRVIRSVGDSHEPRAFRTFGAMLLAGIGSLPRTIEDRSLIITLKRKRGDEAVVRFRSSRCEHLTQLNRKISRWVNDHRQALNDPDPSIPGELGDRAADNWRPLLAIADLAGGVWPEKVRAAAIKLSGEVGVEDESIHIQLLSDIRTVFDPTTTSELSSTELVHRLTSLEDRPWADWSHGKPITPKKVANLVGKFGIRPRKLKTGKRPNGYRRNEFDDAFSRYLPT